MMNIQNERDELLSMYSDVHKDAYGFRPREAAWAEVRAMSLDELRAEMDYLGKVAAEEYDREVKAEGEAALRLWATAMGLAMSQNVPLATAYRWLIEAEGEHVDLEHFLWLSGVGCGNIARTMQAEIGLLGVK